MSGSQYLLPDAIRDQVRMEIGRRVATDNIQVPVLPQVAQHVIALTSNPESSAADFQRVIRMDVQLAGRLLKIANSPAYMTREKVTSIQRAIVTVGVRTLRDLALAISMSEPVFRSHLLFRSMERVWEHSIATGYAAHRIAEMKGLDRNMAFLCGLLHDCGKPILIHAMERVLHQRADLGAFGVLLADDIMREYHAQVGAMVGRTWKFNDALIGAIAYHHKLDEAGEHLPMAQLVHVANLFAHAVGYGSYENEEDADFERECERTGIGLTASEKKLLREKLPEHIKVLIEQFRG